VSIREGRIESLVRKVTGKDAQGIRLNGIDDVLVRYTKCCNPLPGDEIIGFITRGRGITVHRRNCAKAFDTDPERRVEISWDARAKINRPVQIKVMTANRPGILATVGHTFHEQGIARPPVARATTGARPTPSRSSARTWRSSRTSSASSRRSRA
jgi:GTP pyrophosphokinase